MSIESGFSINSVLVAPVLHQRVTDIKKERWLDTLQIKVMIGVLINFLDSTRHIFGLFVFG